MKNIFTYCLQPGTFNMLARGHPKSGNLQPLRDNLSQTTEELFWLHYELNLMLMRDLLNLNF
jgi:hypothetical protein